MLKFTYCCVCDGLKHNSQFETLCTVHHLWVDFQHDDIVGASVSPKLVIQTADFSYVCICEYVYMCISVYFVLYVHNPVI